MLSGEIAPKDWQTVSPSVEDPITRKTVKKIRSRARFLALWGIVCFYYAARRLDRHAIEHRRVTELTGFGGCRYTARK